MQRVDANPHPNQPLEDRRLIGMIAKVHGPVVDISAQAARSMDPSIGKNVCPH
ncbi:MAG TPA: hypothetical protein VH681_08045 [Nitrospiraceae bacterium]|jgi:hypothetical protein